MNTVKKVKIVILVLLFSVSNNFYAANNVKKDKFPRKTVQQTISGTVIDDYGVPLPGASVVVKNTTTGTTTDLDGKFSLKTSTPTTLVVSFLGYKTKEVPVKSAAKKLRITLEEESFFMDDIVVTARKRVENVQDIPIAITALKAEQMSEMGVNDLTGVASIAPNVSFSTAGTVSGSGSNAVVFMRGIGQNDYTPVVDPGVGIYVDEVYLGRSIGAVLDIADLKSVEVIRGPQGTLFGRNSIGGAISLTSMDPGKRFSGNISYTDGTYSRNDATVSLRGPISDDLGLTFNFIRRNRDGYVERVNVKDSYLGNENAHVFRMKMKYGNPDKKFGVTFIADYAIEREESAPEQNANLRPTDLIPNLWNRKIGPAALESTASGYVLGDQTAGTNIYDNRLKTDPFKTGETSLSQNDIDAYGMSANFKYDLNDNLESKLIVAYRELDAKFARQVDGTSLNIFENRDVFLQDQFSADLRLTRDTDKLDFVAGAFYFQENVDHSSSVDGALKGVVWPAQTGGDVANSNYAGYAEITYNITEKFSVTAGGRYTFEKKRARPNAFSDPTGNLDDGLNEPGPRRNSETNPSSIIEPRRFINKIWQENTFDQITWRGAMSYLPIENVNIYGSVSTGFKSGGFAWRITNPNFHDDFTYNDYDGDGFGDLPQFDPETVISYEVGTKFDFPETGIRLNIAGFFSDYRDLQVSLNPQGSIATFQSNAGDAEIKGLETELTLSPFKGFLMNVAYGYTDAKYTKISDPRPDLTVSVSKEDEFILTPKHSLSGSISQKFMLPNELGSLTPNVTGVYKSETQFEAVNAEFAREDGYVALNAALKYEAPRNWQVIFGVENLTNELYKIGGDANGVIGYENVIYARPINYYGTLSYSF